MNIPSGFITGLRAFSTTPAPYSPLKGNSQVITKPIGLLTMKLSAYDLMYDDPYWRLQWNMQDYRTDDMPVMDLNVVPVHNMGYTGKGVKVAVVDNGVEYDCPEIIDNFIPGLSYDMCQNSPDQYTPVDSHGTSCAGVIAMKPNNNLCGVGIAYDAKIVGLRAICGKGQEEFTTAKALIHEIDNIDIYSNSWGFNGDGRAVHTLDRMTAHALTKGTSQGRNKKGAIYVKSVGDSKEKDDNCAADGEVNNIYVIAVGAANQWGKPTEYTERCAAVFTTAYSQSSDTEGIVAPLLNGGCYSFFGGTSAACSQVSAIIALALEANPELTYRDVMHLITMSAEVAPLADNEHTWYKNGRGFWVSNDFGFGLMNAENMVNLAKTWENVPMRKECIEKVSIPDLENFNIYSAGEVKFTVSACKGLHNEVNYLEHIELISEAGYAYRGDITVDIKSPSGTTTKLLEARYKDNDPYGLKGWSIMSTHNWGEDPRGEWTVSYAIAYKRFEHATGYVKELTLKLHGTNTMPAHYQERRVYAAFSLPDGKTS